MQYLARSQIEQIDPGRLVSIVKLLSVGGYLQTVTTAALVYDALITIDREAKYFWKVPRMPVDFVYFSNRYVGILGAAVYLLDFTLSVNLEECEQLYFGTHGFYKSVKGNFELWTHGIANWITVILTDYVLTIRVLALYSRDRVLSICLYSFLVLETAAKLASFLFSQVFEGVALGGAEGIEMCGSDRLTPWQLGVVDWSIQLGYGVILMALALHKAAEYWRLSTGFKGFALVKVLIEDQVIYFMAVILVSVFAMLDLRLSSSNAVVFGVLYAFGNPASLCILGSRMLLNLKEAGERGQNEGTSFMEPSRTISDMEFGQPPANVGASQTEEVIEELE